jgi:hypothetical protein
MKKRSLFYFFVAALALVLMAGCSQATDGSTTTVGLNSLWGTITAEKLQAAVDRAVASGESLEFEDGLSIGTGQVNLRNTRITVYGTVTNAALLNAAYATVTRADDEAGITNTGVYIYPQGMEHDWITGAGAKVEFVPGGLKKMMSTATAVAVREYKLGPTKDVDYSTGEAVDPQLYTTATLTDIYVLDKLTIPGDSNVTATAIALTALGTVDFTGDVNISGIAANKLVFAAPSVLTSSKDNGVEITLPVSVPAGVLSSSTINVKAESNRNLTFKGATTALTVAKLEGPGILVFDADPTAVTVNSGTGTIQFIQPVTSGTFVFKDKVAAVFNRDIAAGTFTPTANTSTGKVTFEKKVDFAAASTIPGDVEFKDDASQTGILTLGGNVTIANGVELTLTNADVNLGTGKSVFVGPAKVLTAVGSTVLTPAGASTLTAGAAAPATNPSEQDLLTAKTLTLAVQDLVITSGVLEAASEGIFAIDTGITVSTTSPVSGTTPGGFLRLAPGGTINLTANDAVIAFGATPANVQITGAIAALRASGAAITLGNGTIQGGGSGAALAITGNDAVIGFNTGVTGDTIVLDAVTLNLTANGVLSILNAAAPNSVSLKNQAKVLLNNEAGVNNANGYIKGGQVATISGIPIAKGATDAAAAAVYSIAHDTGNPVLLIGPIATGPTNLSKTGTTFEAVP